MSRNEGELPPTPWPRWAKAFVIIGAVLLGILLILSIDFTEDDDTPPTITITGTTR